LGCPSPKVQRGTFGVCLMKDPSRVRAALESMVAASEIPVTVKCRIGVDEHDDEEYFFRFVEEVMAAGVKTVVVHARKAWLKGLNPKQNRDIPPLNYQRVYRLKERYSSLEVVINGGIHSSDEVRAHLARVDGVMIGRACVDRPRFLHDLQEGLVQANSASITQVLERYAQYFEGQRASGVPPAPLLKPLFHLAAGLPGARAWRLFLHEHVHAVSLAGDGLLESWFKLVGD
jgi:tRNA-dihydrouridine synthase A